MIRLIDRRASRCILLLVVILYLASYSTTTADEEVVADLLIQKTEERTVINASHEATNTLKSAYVVETERMKMKLFSFVENLNDDNDNDHDLENQIQRNVYTTSSMSDFQDSSATNDDDSSSLSSSTCMIKNIKKFMSECMSLLAVRFKNNQYNLIIVVLMSVALVMFVVLLVLFFGNLKRTTASTDIVTDMDDSGGVESGSPATILNSIRHLDLISQASTSTLPSMFINEDKSNNNVIVKSMKSIDLESTDSVKETQMDMSSKHQSSTTRRGRGWWPSSFSSHRLYNYLVEKKNKWKRDTNTEENTYL